MLGLANVFMHMTLFSCSKVWLSRRTFILSLVLVVC
jgi:hypothetical protein